MWSVLFFLKKQLTSPTFCIGIFRNWLLFIWAYLPQGVQGIGFLPYNHPQFSSAYLIFWFSCVWLYATPCTLAHKAPLSMGFCRQDYCSGLPFPSPGDLPNPRTETMSLTSPALASRFFTWEAPLKWKDHKK